MTKAIKKASQDRVSFKLLQEKKEKLSKIESLPYSEKLESVMDRSVFTCPPSAKVHEVVKEMSDRNISSVIVVDAARKPIGILTEKDIVHRIVAENCTDIDTIDVTAVMTREPYTLSPDDTVYRALSLLARQGIKHLPLQNDAGLAGIVTLRQIIKLKYPEPMTLVESIRDAETTGELKEIRQDLLHVAAGKFNMGIHAYDIVVMLSMINQDLHRRAFELALRRHGEPPAPLCLYVTGSHGRLENLLNPDQDHGIIISDKENKGIQYDPYFADMTETFSNYLNEIGFATCTGYIMSVNPLWRKSVSEWKKQVEYWFDNQVREMGRYVTVLFDATPIYGDAALFKDVMDHAVDLLQEHYEVLRVLHEEEGSHRVPTGFLGRFVTEKSGDHKGELNIKRSGLLFVVEGIRILALLHGVRETSTLKRIEKLVKKGAIHRDDGEYFESAYHVLLHHALSTQMRKALNDEPVDAYLNPNNLSQRDREALRHAYKAVSSLQDLVAGEFGELVL